jgi:hypothetical protein
VSDRPFFLSPYVWLIKSILTVTIGKFVNVVVLRPANRHMKDNTRAPMHKSAGNRANQRMSSCFIVEFGGL